MTMRTAFTLLILLSTTVLFAQGGYTYNVEKVADEIYVLHPQGNNYRWVTANIIVVINEEDVLVVDSGLLPAAAEAAIAEIAKLTDKPVKYLFNTHWHGDHWQGNEVFAQRYPGLKIIASKEASDGIQRDGMLWVNKHYIRNFEAMVTNYEERLKKGEKSDGTKFTAAQKQELKEGIAFVKGDIESVKKLKPIFPNMTFDETMTLKSGSREFQFHYLGRGNTRGVGVIFLPNEKILITGDLVVHPSPYESGTFSLEWLETSRKLAAFPYATLIPGHGEVQHDTSYLDFLNALFAEIIKQINEAYLAGSYKLEEFNKVVTHESVVTVLEKEPRFKIHTEKLSRGFVPACVDRVHRKAHDGRLIP